MAKNSKSCYEAQGIPFYRFNPTIEEAYPLLGNLDSKTVVNTVIQTIVQVLGKQLEELVQCLSTSPPPAPSSSAPPSMDTAARAALAAMVYRQ